MSSSVHPTRVAFFASTAAIGGFLFGFDSAVVNGAVFGIQRSFGASSAGTGFAVASNLLGCALVAGRAADRIGRKPVMVITAVVFAATAIWSALAGSALLFTIAARWNRREDYCRCVGHTVSVPVPFLQNSWRATLPVPWK